MSNKAAEVREYIIVKSDDDTAKLTIKGLATKEKEMVISHLIRTAGWNSLVSNHPDANLRTKLIFPFVRDNTITEAGLIAYYASVWGSIKIYDQDGNRVYSPTNSIAVAAADGLLTKPGTEQFTATILPATANQVPTWTIEEGVELTIDSAGLATATANTVDGTYTATATTVDGKSSSDDVVIS